MVKVEHGMVLTIELQTAVDASAALVCNGVNFSLDPAFDAALIEASLAVTHSRL